MNDPLKTYLEGAKEGGWEDKATAFLVQHPDMMGDTKNAWILWLIFNPEAAKAYWRWKLNEAAMEEGKKEWLDEHSKRMADTFQVDVLCHIQRGDTPLEALEKEL